MADADDRKDGNSDGVSLWVAIYFRETGPPLAYIVPRCQQQPGAFLARIGSRHFVAMYHFHRAGLSA